MSTGTPWSTFTHPYGVFSLRHPSEWTATDHGQFATIDGETTTLAVSSFLRPGSSLLEFAAHRFRVESDIYPPLSAPCPYITDTWSGLALASQGTCPGEDGPTLRFMVCAQFESLFVSMTLYTTPDDFETSRERYDQVFRSLSFEQTASSGRTPGLLSRLLGLLRRQKPFTIPKVTPCPSCGLPLRTATARQCRHCGADWHDT